MSGRMHCQSLELPLSDVGLPADLVCPGAAAGLVVFVHGSGSSRTSSRNRMVAAELQARGFATLLFDLLTEAEDRHYARRFDIPFLTRRVLAALDWLGEQTSLAELSLGLFGASTGAAAALEAAAQRSGKVAALVSRGGRPDLAMASLAGVRAACLFIVGGYDEEVLALNEAAYAELRCVKELVVVPGATHLFGEPGTLEAVAGLAGDWFSRYLLRPAPNPPEPRR